MGKWRRDKPVVVRRGPRTFLVRFDADGKWYDVKERLRGVGYVYNNTRRTMEYHGLPIRGLYLSVIREAKHDTA